MHVCYVHPIKKNTVALLVTSNEDVTIKCSKNVAKLKYTQTPLWQCERDWIQALLCIVMNLASQE